MENYKELIKDPVTLRIWSQYFKRADYVLQAVPEPEKDEIVDELKKKLYEDFTIDGAFDDAHRMLDAIDKLGEPEDYLKPIVSDIKLSNILSRYSPLDIIKKLYHAPFSSMRQFLFCILMSLGYILLTIILIVSILKIFVPELGLYINDSGEIFFGFSSGINATELLGLNKKLSYVIQEN